MVLGLIVAALQLAGIINLNIARILLFGSWLVAICLAAASLENAPLRHRAIAAAIAGIPFGLLLIFLERWIVRKRTKGESIPKPKLDPNIVCLGSDDWYVLLDKHEVFRETDHENPRRLRAATVKFTNESKPGKKVASIANVRAEIVYYDTDWPDREAHRVHYGCWLNEETPYVTFDLSDKAVQQLIIGAFEEKSEGGFERRFMIYGNSPDRNAPLTQLFWGECRGFRIKVRVIAGDNGEYTSDYDFDLEIDPGSTYSFEYLSDDSKRIRREGAAHQFQTTIVQGEKLLTRDHDDKFYSEVHEWRWGTEGQIRKLFGLRPSERFHNAGNLQPHGKESRFMDEIKSQLETLKELAREFDSGELILPFDL